jgi:hypothetical protein
MTAPKNELVKKILGGIPYTAELYWLIRQKDQPTKTRFSFKSLQENLPQMIGQVQRFQKTNPKAKKVFIFASLHYWIEQATATALGLATEGHQVTLGYLPYFDWFTDQNRFDLRRQNSYARAILKQTEPLIRTLSFLNHRSQFTILPQEIKDAVTEVTIYDTQYTLQLEEIDLNHEVYKLRYERNTDCATEVFAYLKTNRPDVVIIPNGTILEFGVVYRIAKYLGIPVTTYEFNDQRGFFWIGQNEQIMKQNTDEMWEVGKHHNLTVEQEKRIQTLFQKRRQAKVVDSFTRTWQAQPSKGGEAIRKKLKLDTRPIVLLPTNVLGDSLTLGRQVFSKTMAEWVVRTVQYFFGRPDTQLIIRIHPGEILTRQYSMIDLLHQALPELPENIHIVGPREEINTYDLVDLSSLGLVYTTTIGLEMALKGLPVIVAGQTHYRKRSFTYDPDSWVEYFKILGLILTKPESFRLTKEKIKRAWQYSYLFFYVFPQPFPWHIKALGDYADVMISKVFNAEGRRLYSDSFRYLTGEPINWKKKCGMNSKQKYAI